MAYTSLRESVCSLGERGRAPRPLPGQHIHPLCHRAQGRSQWPLQMRHWTLRQLRLSEKVAFHRSHLTAKLLDSVKGENKGQGGGCGCCRFRLILWFLLLCLLPKQQHLPLPLTVVMDLDSLQFPTPRLVTAATFGNERVREYERHWTVQREREVRARLRTRRGSWERDWEANNSLITWQ